MDSADKSKAKVFAVLLAAGSATRYGKDKLQEQFEGTPVWLKAYQALNQSPTIDAIGIVTSPDKVAEIKDQAPDTAFVIPGGTTRQESSKLGTQAVPEDFDIVLIHDAARPFLTEQVIFNVVQGIKTDGAAYPAITATDTFRERLEDGTTRLLDRDRLLAAQTPQGATRQLLLQAHNQATETYTDEAALLEAAGTTPLPVPGDPQNRKITHPGDLEDQKPQIRTGLGYDVHSFSNDPDRPLWLGGIEFPDDKPGLEGHSDADALLHAVVDALLGAVNKGDIGLLYPNTDPRWKDCPSLRFLEETAANLRTDQWQIINIDATVIAERPKVMPRRMEICQAIANACGIDPQNVSVKATTNERLGAIGRAEGIAAFAVATVSRP